MLPSASAEAPRNSHDAPREIRLHTALCVQSEALRGRQRDVLVVYAFDLRLSRQIVLLVHEVKRSSNHRGRGHPGEAAPGIGFRRQDP
jgi:hypothetical protein